MSYKIARVLDYEGITRKFFQYITITGTAFVWWIGLAIVYFMAPIIRSEVVSMFLVNTIMTLVVYALKLSFRRPRPEFRDDRMSTVSFDIYSLPSGHATRSLYVAMLMPVYVPSLTIFWFIWAIIMIFSRLVIGVHYISDILAGIVIGVAGISLMYMFGWLPIFPFL